MYTVSSIIEDINKGCAINNMVEDKFSYRIVYYINEKDISRKHYVDTLYSGLRKSLETIIRNNLSLENTVVIAAVTVRKNVGCVCLLSRAYPFNLYEYFQQITGRCTNGSKKRNATYGRYVTNAN